ncbi:energy-coupling factor transporter transmembrane component T family protein [Compostimonas suwonensis]|uniref:Energy-coupling factor transport system permease protein n=1 Tax=Compostimonas suwonensis TaxID=1048394 RepID=A0A2M9BZN7_9MICO|nr:energy-coupling factor transporter transmembrane component T [Compostimonas suwonensis]PJJ63536.1 energy-coupling factor transport system permease protein [Compostimonas suwonensis]
MSAQAAVSGVPSAVSSPVLDRINPVTKLGAALLLSLMLVLSIDWVSAAVALVAELVLFACARIPFGALARRSAPILIAAPLAGLTTLLYGRLSGEIFWEFGLIRISEGSIDLAIATVLRVLAVGFPAVLLFITIDPTDLADGLAQIVRLPSRFVLGALAGLRLVGLFIDDWRALSLARRARGIADEGGALGRVRRFGGQAFALLVLSIRRGSKLATAMEARAFGSPIRRSWARESTVGWRDAALLVIAFAVAALAIGVAVAVGSWNFVLG